MTAHPNADLFAMTPADTAAMRAVARRQVQARIGIYAAPRPAVEVAAQPEGQKERALLRAMIDAAKAKRESVRAESKQAAKTGGTRISSEEVEARMSEVIGAPKTAAQIAEESGLLLPTVKTNLHRLARAGQIEAFAQPRHKSGQKRPFLYASVGTFAKPHYFNEMKNGPVNASRRDAVLALLSKPMAAFEVAQTLGISKQKARYQIQCLAADGLILPAGRTDTFRAKGIQQWARA